MYHNTTVKIFGKMVFELLLNHYFSPEHFGVFLKKHFLFEKIALLGTKEFFHGSAAH